MKNYQKTYLVLKDLLNKLKTDSESSLLQIGGLGPAKVKRILEARASVKEGRRLLRMMDIVNLNRLGLGTLTDDPDAADIAKCIAYYEREFSMGKKLQKMVKGEMIERCFDVVNSLFNRDPARDVSTP